MTVFLAACGTQKTQPIVTPEPAPVKNDTIVEPTKEAVPEKPTTTTTPVKEAGAKSYTTAEVATHSSTSSCWLIIDAKVYDVTKFIPSHPGGKEILN